MLAIPSRVIAACFALVGFAATAMLGVAAGNDAVNVIRNASVVMVIGWGIGWAVGLATRQCVNEHIEQYKQANPIPGDSIDEHIPEEPADPARPAEPVGGSS